MPRDDVGVHYRVALEEAVTGLNEGGIPIGASLTRRGELLGAGHNRRVQNADPTAHAEIDCLRAVGPLDSYGDTTLYTTLAPCFLCSGAVVLFGIPRVVVGDTTVYDGEGSLELLAQHGVELTYLADDDAREILERFITNNRRAWLEDIGK
jgi:cytosine/creatinine deaminase